MESHTTNRTQREAQGVSYATISTEIMLGLATGPLLLGILAGKTSLKLLQALGEASEEVFRGDRLPILEFSPNSPQPEVTTD